MFAELSSSQTSRLIRNERRLNPLWKFWRGTDPHAFEALLWSPARKSANIYDVKSLRERGKKNPCLTWEDMKCSTLESYLKKKLKTFPYRFFFFFFFSKCYTSLNYVRWLESSLFNPLLGKSPKILSNVSVSRLPCAAGTLVFLYK